ncbi:hypothetical protein LX36DRAFT_26008 [Colletotrichum falcatum]|nr:hypothetical protein LX36DRAFT_26008 [Colletotrichum falcatum]
MIHALLALGFSLLSCSFLWRVFFSFFILQTPRIPAWWVAWKKRERQPKGNQKGRKGNKKKTTWKYGSRLIGKQDLGERGPTGSSRNIIPLSNQARCRAHPLFLLCRAHLR